MPPRMGLSSSSSSSYSSSSESSSSSSTSSTSSSGLGLSSSSSSDSVSTFFFLCFSFLIRFSALRADLRLGGASSSLSSDSLSTTRVGCTREGLIRLFSLALPLRLGFSLLEALSRHEDSGVSLVSDSESDETMRPRMLPLLSTLLSSESSWSGLDLRFWGCFSFFLESLICGDLTLRGILLSVVI